MMKIQMLPILIGSSMLLMTACDTEYLTENQTESRTRIIGGVPVHDQDFKLATQSTEQTQHVAK